MNDIYSFSAKDIDGKARSLSEFSGKVLLIVNVASKCGHTPQYAGLQSLYHRFKDRGFEILGFPSNDFMGQEPGTEAQIKEFCSVKYGVGFPMFSKVSVKGKGIDPLFAYLTSKEANPKHAGKVTWNFNKFLIDREGRVVDRFDTKDEPMEENVLNAVSRAL
jgi:glutathione peroxidase